MNSSQALVGSTNGSAPANGNAEAPWARLARSKPSCRRTSRCSVPR